MAATATAAVATASAARPYLIAYNGAMLFGWGVVLTRLARHFASGGTVSEVYERIRRPLLLAQTGAVLEILHAMLKLVRSPVKTTFLQVLSRVLVVWGALEIGSKDVTQSWILVQMVLAWTLSELIRYSYYVVGLVQSSGEAVPSWLTWLRYSAFAVLYPIGITGEMGCFIKALPFIQKNQTFSVSIPNSGRVLFNYLYFVWFALVGLYPGGSYVMYSYMLSQRAKYLRAVK